MPDAKRTKRVRDAAEELTLEEHIAAKRAVLVRARQEAPELRARAEALRARAEGTAGRWLVRAAADLRREAAELDAEAAVRESMQREHEFETTVVTYLRTYYQRPATAGGAADASRKSDTIEAYVRHHDLSGQRRAAILDEYLTQMEQAPPKVAMSARDECPCCNVKFLLCSSKSTMSCPRCGYSVAYLDATSTSTSFDESIEFSPYSYKRANHFNQWLTLTQGRESHRVPDDILNAVMQHLYAQQKVTNPAQVTQKHVRIALRKLRLRRAYDHVAQVTSRISGIPPLRIPPDAEEKLRNMFLLMQAPFQRHAPKSRTNFLSYSFVLFKLFQILGMHDMLDGISLLKGQDKLEANDVIFRKMSADLGWPVFELPPQAR
jgi:hypothetical protein